MAPSWAIYGNARARGPGPASVAAGPSARSLVLSSATSQSLSLTTPWGTATDNKKVTVSFWIKPQSTAAGDFIIYEGGMVGSGFSDIHITGFDSNKLMARWYDGTTIRDVQIGNDGSPFYQTTTWVHACISYDSTPATPVVTAYINGKIVSKLSDVPAQNSSWQLTHTGNTSWIGQHSYGGGNINLKLAYFYLIDGQVLTAQDFVTGSGSGYVRPKTYSGTYGNNGFFLDFTGNSTNDQSGQGHHWTQNNAPTFDTDLPGTMWLPTDLTGLIGWYKSDGTMLNGSGLAPVNNNELLSQWSDYSGLNNHLLAIDIGAPCTGMYNFSPGLNSKRTVYFDGNGGMTCASFPIGTGGVASVYMYCSVISTGSTFRSWNCYAAPTQDATLGANSFVFNRTDNPLTSQFNVNQNVSYGAATISTDTGTRLGSICDGANTRLILNGTPQTPATLSSFSFNDAGNFIVGGNKAVLSGFAGGKVYIDEILITRSNITSGLANLDAYMTRWN